jgi:hypothetical protein
MTAPLDYPDEREIRFEEAAQGHDAVLRRGALGSGVKDCILALALDDFLSLDIRPRETILAPWLPRCGLAMIHAPRGLGKTQVAIGTAWAMERWQLPSLAMRQGMAGALSRWRDTRGRPSISFQVRYHGEPI